ncbi:septum formation initiator family protein [Blastococcus sp. SYSU D00820]
MTGPRGRRGSRRASTGRPLSHAASRPVPAGRTAAASRPEQRRPGRRTARGSTAAAAAPRRPLFTGRAVLLGGLVLLLALTLAGPVRQYLAGRAELARLVAEGTELDAELAARQAELEAQADPAYVGRQARERLLLVQPGDRVVVVVDAEDAEGDAGTVSDAAEPADQPWYEALMGSLATADDLQPADGDGPTG